MRTNGVHSSLEAYQSPETLLGSTADSEFVGMSLIHTSSVRGFDAITSKNSKIFVLKKRKNPLQSQNLNSFIPSVGSTVQISGALGMSDASQCSPEGQNKSTVISL